MPALFQHTVRQSSGSRFIRFRVLRNKPQHLVTNGPSATVEENVADGKSGLSPCLGDETIRRNPKQHPIMPAISIRLASMATGAAHSPISTIVRQVLGKAEPLRSHHSSTIRYQLFPIDTRVTSIPVYCSRGRDQHQAGSPIGVGEESSRKHGLEREGR
jgi:hypothetical protein